MARGIYKAVAGSAGSPVYLSQGELNVLKGALDLAHKAANRAMTPLGRVFMLDTNAVLDHATLSRIVESGFSR